MPDLYKSAQCERFFLSEAKKIGEYVVLKIVAEAPLKKRINALLVSEGSRITLLYVKNGKAVIYVGGVIIGLSRSVAQKIEVASYDN